tara:strand:+ start:331 stop:633 length:303 start_codon:yes stop_codon:yes gene_type:complete
MDLNQKDWKNQIDNDSVIIDVRTPEEFEISRIPDSINIDFNNPVFFMQEIQKLNKNVSYYIYCRTGVRSANSCLLMKELGFDRTHNLLGGIVEWRGETVN